MAQYMLLIYLPSEGGLSPEEGRAELPRWMEYTQALRDEGALVADNALQPVDTATTVRVRGGETVVSDGPFADTKEILGGYYVIDVADVAEAQRWATRIPSVERGSVEVRPVMVFAEADLAAAQAAARA